VYKTWVVNQRYNTFKELNNRLHKNMLYKDKIPDMPPHRIMKKSREVVEERIAAFTSKLINESS
jgi:hypothetical protein